MESVQPRCNPVASATILVWFLFLFGTFKLHQVNCSLFTQIPRVRFLCGITGILKLQQARVKFARGWNKSLVGARLSTGQSEAESNQMSENSAAVKELLWLATYYERNDMDENAQLIRESIESTRHMRDDWAPIRYIEQAVARLTEERKSA